MGAGSNTIKITIGRQEPLQSLAIRSGDSLVVEFSSKSSYHITSLEITTEDKDGNIVVPTFTCAGAAPDARGKVALDIALSAGSSRAVALEKFTLPARTDPWDLRVTFNAHRHARVTLTMSQVTSPPLALALAWLGSNEVPITADAKMAAAIRSQLAFTLYNLDRDRELRATDTSPRIDISFVFADTTSEDITPVFDGTLTTVPLAHENIKITATQGALTGGLSAAEIPTWSFTPNAHAGGLLLGAGSSAGGVLCFSIEGIVTDPRACQGVTLMLIQVRVGASVFTAALPINMVPVSRGIVSFGSMTPTIAPGADGRALARLSWVSTGVDKLLLSYVDGATSHNVDVAPNALAGTPLEVEVGATTTFTLAVPGAGVASQRETTVTVLPPPPVIRDVRLSSNLVDVSSGPAFIEANWDVDSRRAEIAFALARGTGPNAAVDRWLEGVSVSRGVFTVDRPTIVGLTATDPFGGEGRSLATWVSTLRRARVSADLPPAARNYVLTGDFADPSAQGYQPPSPPKPLAADLRPEYARVVGSHLYVNVGEILLAIDVADLSAVSTAKITAKAKARLITLDPPATLGHPSDDTEARAKVLETLLYLDGQTAKQCRPSADDPFAGEATLCDVGQFGVTTLGFDTKGYQAAGRLYTGGADSFTVRDLSLGDDGTLGDANVNPSWGDQSPFEKMLEPGGWRPDNAFDAHWTTIAGDDQNLLYIDRAGALWRAGASTSQRPYSYACVGVPEGLSPSPSPIAILESPLSAGPPVGASGLGCVLARGEHGLEIVQRTCASLYEYLHGRDAAYTLRIPAPNLHGVRIAVAIGPLVGTSLTYYLVGVSDAGRLDIERVVLSTPEGATIAEADLVATGLRAGARTGLLRWIYRSTPAKVDQWYEGAWTLGGLDLAPTPELPIIDGGDVMYVGQHMDAGASLSSPSGRFVLRFAAGPDPSAVGDLELIEHTTGDDGRPKEVRRWSAGVTPAPGLSLFLADGCHLQIRDAQHAAIWTAHNQSDLPNGFRYALVVRDDGAWALTLDGHDNWTSAQEAAQAAAIAQHRTPAELAEKAVASGRTAIPDTRDTVTINDLLVAPRALVSAGGVFTARFASSTATADRYDRFQVVALKDTADPTIPAGKEIWSVSFNACAGVYLRTEYGSVPSVIIAADGDVLLAMHGGQGVGAATDLALVLQDDGNLVLYSGSSHTGPCWASNVYVNKRG